MSGVEPLSLLVGFLGLLVVLLRFLVRCIGLSEVHRLHLDFGHGVWLDAATLIGNWNILVLGSEFTLSLLLFGLGMRAADDCDRLGLINLVARDGLSLILDLELVLADL